MKGLGGLITIVAVFGIAIYVWLQYQGQSVGGTVPPAGRPDVSVPDANESAARATSFMDWFADWIVERSQTFWQIIAILIVVGICRYVFKRIPTIVWLGLGIIVGIVVISVW